MRTLPSELLVQVVIIYSVKKKQGSPSAESARREGRQSRREPQTGVSFSALIAEDAPKLKWSSTRMICELKATTRWVATVASEGPWAMTRIYARTKLYLRVSCCRQFSNKCMHVLVKNMYMLYTAVLILTIQCMHFVKEKTELHVGWLTIIYPR